MPAIKMKKGYPTSDGVMHDTHKEAIKRQCEIEFRQAVSERDESEDVEEFIKNNTDIVSNFIKYCIQSPKPAQKKKTTKK